MNTTPEEAPISPGIETTGINPVDPESPATVEASTPANVPHEEGPDIDTLIAEAEQRGYLRGRNEAIERLMARPDDSVPGLDGIDDSTTTHHDTLILNTYRPSIWD